MNLKRFRERHGLTSVEIVEILSRTWPKFGKATMSMVENPEKYGVKLLPQAEAILRREIKKREG
jgi:hypothetical protein